MAIAPLPAELADRVEALSGCIAGAAPVDEVEALLKEAGFEEVVVKVSEQSKHFIAEWIPGSGAENYVASATIEARRPGGSCCAPSCCEGEADAAS